MAYVLRYLNTNCGWACANNAHSLSRTSRMGVNLSTRVLPNSLLEQGKDDYSPAHTPNPLSHSVRQVDADAHLAGPEFEACPESLEGGEPC